MKTVCVIQARMGATRLPGKVLMPIVGKPMLAHQLERDLWSHKLDALVVATTDKPEDEAVAALAAQCGVAVYRGSESDVLDRYYQAAKQAGADVVVRVTGDCPLHYGDIIDETVEHFMSANVDYARSREDYPEGLDTEICTFAALERAWKEAKLPSEREHVTPYIYTHPELFVCDSTEILAKRDSHGMHWSVDTKQDFAFVTKIFEALYPTNPKFIQEDVFTVLKEHPEWLEINKDQTGYEGYAKSLEEDKNSFQ
jgi:spore coat polysaccharide biosynthesis protein SpsF (cytidylyltransferase family)